MTGRIRARLASLLLLLLPFSALVFVACDDGHPEFDFSIEADYSEVIRAIKDSDKSLSDRVALIEAAVNSGLAESGSMVDLIKEALASMEGTIEEKLAAVEAAIAEQTMALETKMALVEAAVATGLTDKQNAIGLINEALNALDGGVDVKIAAINLIIGSQTTALESKTGLISSALETGVMADTAAVNAFQAALESSLGNLDSDLSDARDDIINTISGIAAKVTPAELAKAFKGITDAIDSHSQSIADLLAAILKVVQDLEAEANCDP